MKHQKIWANLSSIIGRIEQIEELSSHDSDHHRMCDEALNATLGEANEIMDVLEEYLEENDLLRSMLARCYSGPRKLYCDDGELQDNSERPFIDFKRDSAKDIERKIRERSMNWIAAHPNEFKSATSNLIRKDLDGTN